MKPITFLDLETTGTDKTKDRIVEIAMVKIGAGPEIRFHSLVNPEMPIPQGASDVHGITDDMVKDMPTLKTLLPMIIPMVEGCDLAGFNSNAFDNPLLYVELMRVGYTMDLSSTLFLDARTIFVRKEERTLSAAVKFYLGKDHEGAHGAMADVQATMEVFKAQRSAYEDIKGLSRADLALYCNYDRQRVDISGNFVLDADGDHIFTMGKHKGRKAKEERDYLRWMLGADFLPDTKAIINQILNSHK